MIRSCKCVREVDHDSCGVGFATRLGRSPSREVVERALTALERLSHRGGLDADGLSGDGAGIEETARMSGVEVPGWRPVPTRPGVLGLRALETLPETWQYFVVGAEPWPCLRR